MCSSKEVIQDLLRLQRAITAQNSVECKNVAQKYQNVVQTYSQNRHELVASIPDDAISRQLMRTDIHINVVPKRSTADGNCLYNSSSILLIGKESLSCTQASRGGGTVLGGRLLRSPSVF